MADDNGALAELRRQLDERTDTVRRIGGKLRDARKERRDLVTSRDAAIAERDAERAAREKALQDYDASPHKAEAERLRGQLRDRDHRAAFDRVAEARGIAKDARDLAWQYSGYRAEGDTPDEDAIGKALDAMKERPGGARLYGESGPPPAPAVGSGRGGRDSTPGVMRVTQAQLADGKWCMEHSSEMRRARAEGKFEIVAE